MGARAERGSSFVSAAAECADWIARGRDHQREDRAVDAMLCFRRASRADPRAPDPHFMLGEVLWQLGRLPDAIASWRQATGLAPSNLAPWQALAESSLAIGDLAAAQDAARRVQALAPGDARAALIAGVVSLSEGVATGDPHPAAMIESALQREPALIGIATLAGPLALALERAPRGVDRSLLLRYVARSSHAQTSAPLGLLALALEEAAIEVSDETRAPGAALVAALRRRGVMPADLDALRRIAVAAGRFEAGAAREFAARYAAQCASALAPGVPVMWPRRTAGERTRVVALVAGDAASTVDLDALTGLSPAAFALTIATVGTPRFALPQDVATVALPPAPDAAAARMIAALDPDVLVDLSGMETATGRLLAQRPARQLWTVASMRHPHSIPIVDRVLDDRHALVDAMGALHRERDRSNLCALDAGALASTWSETVRAHQQGDCATALAGYARMLELQPGYATAHYLSGVAHRTEGDESAARDAFAAALAVAPLFADARLAFANAAVAAGDAESAVTACDQGLLAAPANPALLRALGLAHLARRDGKAARDAFARALMVDMTDGETHYNHGVALQMLHDVDEAIRAYQRALAFRPDLVAAHFNLGVLFHEQGMTDAAVAAYGEVLAADPRDVAAYRNLGEVLLAAGRIDAYLANFRRFEANCPDALPLAVQAVVACQHRGDFAALERYLDGLRNERFAVRGAAELVDACEELLYLLLFFDVDPSVQGQFARTYDAAMRRLYGDPLPRQFERRPGRIRIGYLSADFRNHVMGKMVWAAVRHHDRSRFELYFYSLSQVEDEWTARFRGLADHYDVVAPEEERAAAKRIAADDLDILIDLSTHTKGAAPGIFALKPARVQITHVASAGTVGLSSIDFKLTDRYADVPENQAFQIETLLPMEGCVYPYRHVAAATDHPYRRATLGIAADAVVIGAFVSPLKLSRRCLALWREVLTRVPKARLAFSPADPALRGSYLRLLAAAGIAPDRAVFVPQGRDDAGNQARYMLVDFVLDPMPFGGVNGTLEALDMGVPVVTLVGRRHGERTSFSILSNLGVMDTVTTNGREYTDIAVRLSSDTEFMRAVRRRIDERLRRSPLTDMPAHARALERAYVDALTAKAPEVLAASGYAAE
jgi:predicted O-linked N-acetylglucosamine transferase (SPINDLY family)